MGVIIGVAGVLVLGWLTVACTRATDESGSYWNDVARHFFGGRGGD